MLETPTWRSNPDWGASLGYTQARLADLDRASVTYLSGIRDTTEGGPRPISGLLGPRGDGYAVDHLMTVEESLDYHQHQVAVLSEAGCDLVTACTLTYPAEGTGIALAATEIGVPVVLYVTLETDGRLPDGTSLHEAIDMVDAATDGYVAYFGVNCVHPDHMAPALVDGGRWTARIRAARANASRLSHAELDVAEELDAGDPLEMGADYTRLRDHLPELAVFGGCCGTDVRHLRAIAAAISG